MKKVLSVFLSLCMLFTMQNFAYVSAAETENASNVLFSDDFESFDENNITTKAWTAKSGTIAGDEENHYYEISSNSTNNYPANHKTVDYSLGQTLCISARSMVKNTNSVTANPYINFRDKNSQNGKTVLSISTNGITFGDNATGLKAVNEKWIDYKVYMKATGDASNAVVAVKIWGEGVVDKDANAIDEQNAYVAVATVDLSSHNIAANKAERIVFNNFIKYDKTEGAEQAHTYLDDVSISLADGAVDCGAESIKINGSEIEGFDKDTLTYDVKLDYNVSEANVEALPFGSYTTVSVSESTVTEFPKTVSVVCQNELGIKKEYTINMMRKRSATEVNSEIAKTANGADAMMTMVYDDGFIYTAEFIDEQFAKYNLTGTSMVITSHYETDPARLLRLQNVVKNKRVDIGSHTKTHATVSDDAGRTDVITDIDQITDEIAGSKELLESWFPENDVITFAAPNNTMSAAGYEIVKQNYYAARLGNRGYQSMDIEDGTAVGQWYNLKMFGIGDSPDTNETRNARVDKAIADGYWLFEMWHGVTEGYQGQTINNAINHYKYIASKQDAGKIWVANYTEAVKYLREKQASVSYADLTDSGVLVEVATDNTNLPADIFNYPLTVKTEIPSGWSMVGYSLNGEEKTASAFEENGVNYAYVKVLPNSSTTVTNAGTSALLESFGLNGRNPDYFESNTFDYDILANEDELPIKITAKTKASDASVSLSTTEVTDLPAQVTATVTDGEGNLKVYTVNISRQPSDDCDLKSLTVDGVSVDNFKKDTLSYEYRAADSAVTATVEAQANDKYASVEILPSKTVEVPASVTIKVTAENGDTKTYSLNISQTGSDEIIIDDNFNAKTPGYLLGDKSGTGFSQKNTDLSTGGVVFDESDDRGIIGRFVHSGTKQDYLQINAATGTGITEPLIVKGKMMIPAADTTSVHDVKLRSQNPDGNYGTDYNFVSILNFNAANSKVDVGTLGGAAMFKKGSWVEYTVALTENTENKTYDIKAWFDGDGVLNADGTKASEPLYINDTAVPYDNESLASLDTKLNCRIMYRGILGVNKGVDDKDTTVYIDDLKIYKAGTFKLYSKDISVDAGEGGAVLVKSNHDINTNTITKENITVTPKSENADKTAEIKDIEKIGTDSFKIKFSTASEPGKYTISFNDELTDAAGQKSASTIDVTVKNDSIIYPDIVHVYEDFETKNAGDAISNASSNSAFGKTNNVPKSGYTAVLNPNGSGIVAKSYNKDKAGQNQQLNAYLLSATNDKVVVKGKIMRKVGDDSSTYDVTVRGSDYKLPRIMAFNKDGSILLGNDTTASAYYKNGEWVSFTAVVSENAENKCYDYKIYLNGVYNKDGDAYDSVLAFDKTSVVMSDTEFANNAFSKLQCRILYRAITAYEEEDTTYGWYVDDIKVYTPKTTVLSLGNTDTIDNTDGEFVYIKANHDIDMTSIDTNSIIVKNAAGETVSVLELTAFEDGFKFKLPTDAKEGIYSVLANENAKDILGGAINKSVSFELYDKDAPTTDITSLKISADGETNLTRANVKDVKFTAAAEPEKHIDESTIEWYVNGEKTAQTGKEFTFNTPRKVGEYRIYAKSASVSSNEITVTVTPGDFADDIYFINNETFEGYDEGTSVSKIGSAFGSNLANNISVEKIGDNKALKQYVDSPEGALYVQLNLNLGSNSQSNLYQTGSLYLQDPKTNMVFALRGASSPVTVMQINSNGNVVIGGKTVCTVGLNKWLRYSIAAVPNFDNLANSRARVILTGDAVTDSKGYYESGFITIDLSTVIGDKSARFFNHYAGAKTGTKADNGVFVDNLSVYAAKTFTAKLSKEAAAGDRQISIKLNHEPLLSSLTADNLLLTNSKGEIVEIEDVTFNANDTREITVKTKSALVSNESYELDFLPKFVDLAENSVYDSVKFAANQYSAVEISAVDGSVSAVIDLVSYELGSSYTGSYKAGTAIELTAKKDDESAEFMYWKDNNSGRILSTSETYSFIVGSDISISAVYSLGYYVSFTNINGVVMAGGNGSASVPQSTPYVCGYTFDAWFLNGEKQSLNAGDTVYADGSNKEYVAGFVKDTKTYNVTVTNANEEGGSYTYNDRVSLTAKDRSEEGLVFLYWTKDGAVVSYNQGYSFYVNSDAEVEAVYGSTSAEKKNTVTIFANQADSSRMGFFSEHDIDTKYTVIESGILMGTSENLEIGASGVIKAVAKSKKNKAQFTVRKAGLSAGDVYYGRAYVIYTDGENVYTEYSDVAEGIMQ